MKKAKAKTKLTKNQALVLNVLTKASQPIGAYAILDELRSHGFKAPLTVYRALDQLANEGLVHKLESLNSWTTCCGQQHANPPVFEICDDCGNVTEHLNEELVKNLNTMSEQSGFMPDRSIIEIHGRCDNCGTDAK
ncbi:MAG: FUR family transcriptional regulator [Rhodospirillaceae bacterium]|nr:FUR family transcriptional regulator [Rhodospirillaceae bacterium]